MIWSPFNNNIYFVDQGGNFGYLSLPIGSNSWNTNFLYSFSPAFLKMSVSPNYKYMAISSVNAQSVIIYDITTNSYWHNPSVAINIIAHEWLNNEILYIMPPTSGNLYNYNVTSKSLNMYSCFTSGIYNIFSFHMHILSNSSQ